jgi:hypothetical protein
MTLVGLEAISMGKRGKYVGYKLVTEEMRPFGIYKHNSVDWTGLAQGSLQWRNPVNKVIKFRIQYKAWHYLTK